MRRMGKQISDPGGLRCRGKEPDVTWLEVWGLSEAPASPLGDQRRPSLLLHGPRTLGVVQPLCLA